MRRHDDQMPAAGTEGEAHRSHAAEPGERLPRSYIPKPSGPIDGTGNQMQAVGSEALDAMKSACVLGQLADRARNRNDPNMSRPRGNRLRFRWVMVRKAYGARHARVVLPYNRHEVVARSCAPTRLEQGEHGVARLVKGGRVPAGRHDPPGEHFQFLNLLPQACARGLVRVWIDPE